MYITEELRQTVASMFRFMEEPVNFLMELANRDDDWHLSPSLRLAGERALHISTETMTDAANVIIDALVMRDPGSYPDIIRVLAEEQVVPPEWFQKFEGCLELRNRLVHKFRTLTPSDIHDAIGAYAPRFREYIESVQAYLSI